MSADRRRSESENRQENGKNRNFCAIILGEVELIMEA